MIDELRELNDTFYKIFDDLKEARPSLSGCDEAFTSMAQKILAQYELEYKMLDLKCRVESEREIAKLEARYDRLVPQRWRSRFFHRRKQNYAATLIDIEANEEAERFFAECEARLAAEAEKRLSDCQAEAEEQAESEAAEAVTVESEDEDTPDAELMEYNEGEECSLIEGTAVIELTAGDMPNPPELPAGEDPDPPKEVSDDKALTADKSSGESANAEEEKLMREYQRKKKGKGKGNSKKRT